MRLRVVLNTYGRPAQALAVMEGLRALASGLHEVSYVLAFDAEDAETHLFLNDINWAMPQGVTYDRRPRPASLQDCWNRNMVDPDEADIWLPFGDDNFCATPNWDDLIVQTLLGAPVPELAVLGWHDMANPGQLTVPIFAAGWLKAIAPEPALDTRYPFWGADTAISETWSYVFGMAVPRPEYLLLAGMPGRPNRALIDADADEIWDLYRGMRYARMATAARVRFAHGLPEPSNIAALADAWAARDDVGREHTRQLIEHLRNKRLDNQKDNFGQLVA